MRKKKYFFLCLVLILIDQASKHFFFNEILNTGGIWGMGRDFWWEMIVVVGLFFIGKLFFKSKNKIERLGLMIILSAGVSNLMDRFLYGGVRDFIYWPILNAYGNVADALLVIGAGVVIGSVIVSE